MRKKNVLAVFIGISFILQMSMICFAQDTLDVKVRADHSSPGISNVSLSQKTFNPSKNEQVHIKYKLSGRARVAIGIYDSMGQMVRVITSENMEEAGYNTLIWDGKDQKGTLVPDEVYGYVINAIEEGGRFSIFDPQETGGLELSPRKTNLNKKTGEIEYVLPKAGRVRIRMGISDGPLLMTLLDWEPQQAGRNMEAWDGKDKSGLIDLLKNPGLSVVISAFSLPDNSIITTGNNLTYIKYKDIMPSEQDFNFLTDDSVTFRRSISSQQDKFLHALHDREECHEPEFRIEFVNHKQDAEDILIINGVVPVRILIDEKDKKRLIDSRFEVAFYVDYIFLFEEEQGFSPFTYMWNTKGMSEGEHMLTVNIQSYDKHIGTESVKVKIKRR